MSTTQSMDLYAARPDLYDVMHADHVDDMRFVQEYAGLQGEGARVLELGCGTGRLMVPLLDAGMQVVGVDREPAMLEVARERLAPYGERAELVEGDLCRFSVPGLFDMALVGLNTFMHLLSTREQLDCLDTIRLHLKQAGTLVLDLANPHAVMRDTPLSVVQHRFTRPHPSDPETTVTLWSSTAIAAASQLAHSTLFFDEVQAVDGRLKRTVSEVLLRLTYRYELELLLARAGFTARQFYGDYESSPYEDDSERLICIAAALS